MILIYRIKRFKSAELVICVVIKMFLYNLLREDMAAIKFILIGCVLIVCMK